MRTSSFSSRPLAAVVAVAAVAALALSLFPVVSAQETVRGGIVTVVGGLPQETVDFYLAGDYSEPVVSVEFGEVAEVLLPPGVHSFEAFPAGSDPEADPSAVLGSEAVPLEADTAFSLVAAFDASGDPALFVFEDDVSALEDGVRVYLRHLAVADPLEVYLNGEAVVSEFSHGGAEEGEVSTPDVELSLALSATPTDIFLGPESVSTSDVSTLIAYVVGDLGSQVEDSFGVVWVTYDLDVFEDPDDNTDNTDNTDTTGDTTTTTTDDSTTTTSGDSTTTAPDPDGIPTGDGSSRDGSVLLLAAGAALVALLATAGLVRRS